MRLLLALVFAAFLTMTYAARPESVETEEPTDVAEEAEEYRWRKKVGKALEKVGKWLQGKYTAETEEEQEEMKLINAELDQLAADVKDILDEEEEGVEEVEDEVVPYGLRKKFKKWRKKLAKLGKKIGTAVVINKAAGAIAAASG
uniref:Putative secreted salivary gland peptide n=1 Tax=Ixodes ricinus TaxID=34613 RepID=A0A147BQK5_IXORI